MKAHSYLHKFCPVAAAWLCVYPQVPFLMGFCNFLTQKAQQSPRSLGELTGIGVHTATVDLQRKESIGKVCSLPIPGRAQGLGGWISKPGIVEGVPGNKWALRPLPAQTSARFPGEICLCPTAEQDLERTALSLHPTTHTSGTTTQSLCPPWDSENQPCTQELPKHCMGFPVLFLTEKSIPSG